MDVGRLPPSGRAFWILVLAGLWLLMVQPGSSRRMSLRRRSNPDESQGEAESIHLRDAKYCSWSSCQHGLCLSGKCFCSSGYIGTNCDVEDPLYCSSTSCNHGFCLSGKCVCSSGYTGTNCDMEDSSYCSSTSCKHGSCSSGTCVCHSGYTGTNCDKEAEDSGLVIGLTTGLTCGTVILGYACICCCCGGCCTGCRCLRRPARSDAPRNRERATDTNTVLTTVKAEENVYVDIAVISSGRW